MEYSDGEHIDIVMKILSTVILSIEYSDHEDIEYTVGEIYYDTEYSVAEDIE